MELWKHFLATSILAMILYPLLGLYSLFSFIGGFLIDLDHIFYYYMRFKRIDLKKIHDFFTNFKDKYIWRVRIFHSIEILLIIVALSFASIIFIPIAIGMALHFMMDMLDETKKYGKPHPISIIWMVKQKAL